MTSGLASRLAHTDPRLLLPSHTVSPPERLDLVVAVQLPGSGRELHLLVATDPSGTAHVVPVVDDATGLRRSRPGDGLAAALLRLLAADEDLPGMRLRPGGAAGAGRPGGVEMHLGDGSDHELFAVGSHRLALTLEPVLWPGSVPDVVGALDRAGFTGMLPWVGDVLVPVADGAYGPVAAATVHPADGHQLHDQLVGLVAGHLRGGDEVEPTLQLAHRTGRALAGLHLALAALRGPDPSGWTADTERVAGWRRDASDAVAEAVVLAEGEPGDRLRARRLEVRAAFDALTTSVGSPLLPALPFPGLEALVVVGGGLLVDPLALGPATELRRSPVRDVAACVRAVDHVARSVHRRLVGGGFPAPLERVTSWYEAVREGVLDAYRARLAEEGESELFDERLLWAFEVEAECRSLSRASRFLPTARGISDAALADLLTTA